MISNFSSNRERILIFYYLSQSKKKKKLFLFWAQMFQHIPLTLTKIKLCIKYGRVSLESILRNLYYQSCYFIQFLLTPTMLCLFGQPGGNFYGSFSSCPPIYFILYWLQYFKIEDKNLKHTNTHLPCITIF